MQYVLYGDNAGYWRWRLLANNHRTIADSGEGYVNRADAINGINLVKSSAAAPVVER
ncbi:YegP family protein [Brucella abortus]|uniref:YegP family protein n=1 Tax=Brucella abortus TaxID=235 RepID=UPI00292D8361|nr:DUF1508 domain-containing protein [Brucella abortus]CAJ2334041.1 hypothetical protein ZBPBA_00962 [Brucella abortus]